jgi:hypothetical protein
MTRLILSRVTGHWTPVVAAKRRYIFFFTPFRGASCERHFSKFA